MNGRAAPGPAEPGPVDGIAGTPATGRAGGFRSLLWLFAVLSSAPAFADTLPNAALTPGDTLPVATAQVCTPGYAARARDVPDDVKAEVFREYGIPASRRGQYQVDHLVSLELGGSNDIRNLWPQSYEAQPWNAHAKDELEDRLHDLVCSGRLTLDQARQAIATDWTAAYRNYLGDPGATRLVLDRPVWAPPRLRAASMHGRRSHPSLSHRATIRASTHAIVRVTTHVSAHSTIRASARHGERAHRRGGPHHLRHALRQVRRIL